MFDKLSNILNHTFRQPLWFTSLHWCSSSIDGSFPFLLHNVSHQNRHLYVMADSWNRRPHCKASIFSLRIRQQQFLKNLFCNIILKELEPLSSLYLSGFLQKSVYYAQNIALLTFELSLLHLSVMYLKRYVAKHVLFRHIPNPSPLLFISVALIFFIQFSCLAYVHMYWHLETHQYTFICRVLKHCVYFRFLRWISCIWKCFLSRALKQVCWRTFYEYPLPSSWFYSSPLILYTQNVCLQASQAPQF